METAWEAWTVKRIVQAIGLALLAFSFCWIIATLFLPLGTIASPMTWLVSIIVGLAVAWLAIRGSQRDSGGQS